MRRLNFVISTFIVFSGCQSSLLSKYEQSLRVIINQEIIPVPNQVGLQQLSSGKYIVFVNISESLNPEVFISTKRSRFLSLFVDEMDPYLLSPKYYSKCFVNSAKTEVTFWSGKPPDWNECFDVKKTLAVRRWSFTQDRVFEVTFYNLDSSDVVQIMAK